MTVAASVFAAELKRLVGWAAYLLKAEKKEKRAGAKSGQQEPDRDAQR